MKPFQQNNIFAGSKEIQNIDEVKGISFNVMVQYPSNTPSLPTRIGPYTMDVSVNAEIIDGCFPLVVISHGSGGSHLLYRTVSSFLARNGYIVAMVEHFGNNRNNNELENACENLILRPRHISLTIGNLFSDGFFGGHILKDKTSVIGHSMGGYTALALSGGIPRTREGEVIKTIADRRIKAIVLLAPAAGWFFKGLDGVKIPILALTAEHDRFTPSKDIETVLNCMPDRSLVTFKQIAGAGHFSFLSPFPATMKRPDFLPSTDPEGFDREKFHEQLPKEILDFLNEKL
ncbi:MAG TPA: alpha/beta hydrolase [Candidatus Wallbacteria bacterium]|nr:alpha/beta hydrolase [Candidatus Wallbacteria bacterium]